jgi:hypothetical protein
VIEAHFLGLSIARVADQTTSATHPRLQALADFRARIRKYEEVYETVSVVSHRAGGVCWEGGGVRDVASIHAS